MVLNALLLSYLAVVWMNIVDPARILLVKEMSPVDYLKEKRK